MQYCSVHRRTSMKITVFPVIAQGFLQFIFYTVFKLKHRYNNMFGKSLILFPLQRRL